MEAAPRLFLRGKGRRVGAGWCAAPLGEWQRSRLAAAVLSAARVTDHNQRQGLEQHCRRGPRLVFTLHDHPQQQLQLYRGVNVLKLVRPPRERRANLLTNLVIIVARIC